MRGNFPHSRAALKEVMNVDSKPTPQPPSVDKIAEAIQKVYPDVWRKCYTKHIDAPGNYRGFKAVATTFASVLIETHIMMQQKKLISNGHLINMLLEKYDYPTYFVTEPLLQAMLRTHPPTAMTWGDLVFPFDAVLFMVPRGLLKEPTGAAIYAVGLFHIGASDVGGLKDLPDWLQAVGAHSYARSGVFWLMEPAGLMLHDCAFPSSQALEPDPEWIDKATNEHISRGQIPDMAISGDFTSHMAGIAANLLLVMQARPELVEKGQRTGKRLPKGTPIHSPTFIGRKYATEIRGTRPEASGHFTELRWRSGHMRRQHFGKGRSEEKIIFIDPYIAYSAGLVKGSSDGQRCKTEVA